MYLLWQLEIETSPWKKKSTRKYSGNYFVLLPFHVDLIKAFFPPINCYHIPTVAACISLCFQYFLFSFLHLYGVFLLCRLLFYQNLYFGTWYRKYSTFSDPIRHFRLPSFGPQQTYDTRRRLDLWLTRKSHDSESTHIAKVGKLTDLHSHTYSCGQSLWLVLMLRAWKSLWV